MKMYVLRPTSHTRLRTRDHCTSSTPSDGKGGASPSSLHTTYAWGTNGVSECKMDVKSTHIPTWHQLEHISWPTELFSKTTSWRQAQHKTGRPWHSEISEPLIYYNFIICENSVWIGTHWTSIWFPSPVTRDFTLHSRAHDHTTWFWRCARWDSLWTLSIGLSQFHGHGSCVKWPLLELTLSLSMHVLVEVREKNRFVRCVS